MENYVADSPPLPYPNEVYSSMYINKILKMDIKEGIVSMRGFLRLRWSDSRLKWDPLEWAGIEFLVYKKDEVFIPDVVVSNHMDWIGFAEMDNTVVMTWASNSPDANIQDFNMEYSPNLAIEVFQIFDLSQYPKDTQNVSIIIESWMLDSRYQTLFPLSYASTNFGDDISYSDSTKHETSFKVLGSSAEYNRVLYGTNSFDVIQFNITIRRMSKKFGTMIFWPTYLISVLVLVNMMLDNEEQKIANALAILLVISVYLTIINELLPDSQDYNLYEIAFLMLFLMIMVNNILCYVVYLLRSKTTEVQSRVTEQYGEEELYNKNSLAYKSIEKLENYASLVEQANICITVSVLLLNLNFYIYTETDRNWNYTAQSFVYSSIVVAILTATYKYYTAKLYSVVHLMYFKDIFSKNSDIYDQLYSLWMMSEKDHDDSITGLKCKLIFNTLYENNSGKRMYNFDRTLEELMITFDTDHNNKFSMDEVFKIAYSLGGKTNSTVIEQNYNYNSYQENILPNANSNANKNKNKNNYLIENEKEEDINNVNDVNKEMLSDIDKVEVKQKERGIYSTSSYDKDERLKEIEFDPTLQLNAKVQSKPNKLELKDKFKNTSNEKVLSVDDNIYTMESNFKNSVHSEDIILLNPHAKSNSEDSSIRGKGTEIINQIISKEQKPTVSDLHLNQDENSKCQKYNQYLSETKNNYINMIHYINEHKETHVNLYINAIESSPSKSNESIQSNYMKIFITYNNNHYDLLKLLNKKLSNLKFDLDSNDITNESINMKVTFVNNAFEIQTKILGIKFKVYKWISKQENEMVELSSNENEVFKIYYLFKINN